MAVGERRVSSFAGALKESYPSLNATCAVPNSMSADPAATAARTRGYESFLGLTEGTYSPPSVCTSSGILSWSFIPSSCGQVYTARSGVAFGCFTRVFRPDRPHGS